MLLDHGFEVFDAGSHDDPLAVFGEAAVVVGASPKPAPNATGPRPAGIDY
jgi:hypothetical protein